MSKLKRLAAQDDDVVQINSPISNEEIEDREQQYDLLTPKRFATRYNTTLFKPITITLSGQEYTIQHNCCVNPFCHNYGKAQKRFEEIKGKLRRYKLSGSSKNYKSLYCNDNPIGIGVSQNCKVIAVSNWAIAEEIKRLVQINSVKEIEPNYQFHKDRCEYNGSTPFNDPKQFYKRGKSSGHSQRYQCKSCQKFTNVLPNRKATVTYNQKRNDILPMFAKMLLGKVSVSRTCDILEIGVETYYNKLEWLYRRCLEFLERHETQAFQAMTFKEIWLNTDKMHYNLNNVRKKGQGSKKYSGLEDLNLQTYIVVTSDVLSRYVFRSDIAYDWNVSMDELEADTRKFKEDHLNTFSRKNARLDWSYYPQEPSKNDTENEGKYRHELNQIINRNRYVDGLNVASGYTSIAHYWLIKHMVNSDEWRMVSDDDPSIRNAFYRIFSKETQLSDAHHFVCQEDKTKTRRQCEEEFEVAKEDLLDWGNLKGHRTKNLRQLAYYYLTELFTTHQFHEEAVNKDGEMYRRYANNPIRHPLASKDKGFHSVDCRTDLSALEPNEIAKLILNVNDHSTNSFIQQIRRYISTLERPLTTARGDKKSYIYANFNPKYAQYAITILRTYYNFCSPYKSSDNKYLTPAQRMGITDKKFDWNDIIYFK